MSTDEDCCGCCSYSQAARIFAVLDIGFGALGTFWAGMHIKHLHFNRDDYPSNFSATKLKEIQDDLERALKRTWIPYLILVCSAIEVLLGFLLLWARHCESIKLCRVYVIASWITCPYTLLFLLRLFPMAVVVEFANLIRMRHNMALSSAIMPRTANNIAFTSDDMLFGPGPFGIHPAALSLEPQPSPQRRDSLPSYYYSMAYPQMQITPVEDDKPPSYQEVASVSENDKY